MHAKRSMKFVMTKFEGVDVLEAQIIESQCSSEDVPQLLTIFCILTKKRNHVREPLKYISSGNSFAVPDAEILRPEPRESP